MSMRKALPYNVWSLLAKLLGLVLLLELLKGPILGSHGTGSYTSIFPSTTESTKAAIDTANAATKKPKFLKATLMYGDPVSPWYVRAHKLHQTHADRHKYGLRTLDKEVAKLNWSKPWFITLLLNEELAKPVEDRADWLFWFDADTVPLNQQIPLDIFLPPQDFDEQTHLLVAKENGGMNTGTFLLRVNLWSLELITSSLSVPLFSDQEGCNPNSTERFVDQRCMELVSLESHFRDNVTIVPRTWFNSLGTRPEPLPGNFMAHFPGDRRRRQEHMEYYLDRVEKLPNEWDVPYEKTSYPEEIGEFWDLQRKAPQLIKQANDKVAKEVREGREAKDLQAAAERLKHGLFEFEVEIEESLKAYNETMAGLHLLPK